MRKIFIALCTMVSVITGNAQNTPIGENIELAGENPEELKVIYVNKDVSTHFMHRQVGSDYQRLAYITNDY